MQNFVIVKRITKLCSVMLSDKKRRRFRDRDKEIDIREEKEERQQERQTTRKSQTVIKSKIKCEKNQLLWKRVSNTL